MPSAVIHVPPYSKRSDFARGVQSGYTPAKDSDKWWYEMEADKPRSLHVSV